MRVVIRKLGNSRGVIIPKSLLAQAGLRETADMLLENGSIVLRRPNPRDGWAEASKAIAAAGEDRLVWPEFGNKDDEALRW